MNCNQCNRTLEDAPIHEKTGLCAVCYWKSVRNQIRTMNKPKNTCFNCAYGHNLEHDFYVGGECRRYAKTQVFFPPTNAMDWCGEHKKKQTKTNQNRTK